MKRKRAKPFCLQSVKMQPRFLNENIVKCRRQCNVQMLRLHVEETRQSWIFFIIM